ncbi:TPA: hypothetical protein DCG61_01250 [Patescibacteria group bacterium]|jgi:hypothetical protein|nr:hypothetical protein [Patescibacteria group bacterium]
MGVKLREMEHVRAVYRQSKWVLIHPILANLFTVALPWYFIVRYDISGWITTVLWLWSVIVLAHLAIELLLWYLNRYVVTNMRLMHYDQTGLFKRTIIETPHERILNVSFKTEGVTSAIFGYGNVVVQVVGLIDPMVLKNVSNPLEIKDYIWEMHLRVTANDKSFNSQDIEHIQERLGYTKQNQKV